MNQLVLLYTGLYQKWLKFWTREHFIVIANLVAGSIQRLWKYKWLCSAVALQGSAENHDGARVYLVSKYYKRLFEKHSVTHRESYNSNNFHSRYGKIVGQTYFFSSFSLALYTELMNINGYSRSL